MLRSPGTEVFKSVELYFGESLEIARHLVVHQGRDSLVAVEVSWDRALWVLIVNFGNDLEMVGNSMVLLEVAVEVSWDRIIHVHRVLFRRWSLNFRLLSYDNGGGLSGHCVGLLRHRALPVNYTQEVILKGHTTQWWHWGGGETALSLLIHIMVWKLCLCTSWQSTCPVGKFYMFYIMTLKGKFLKKIVILGVTLMIRLEWSWKRKNYTFMFGRMWGS